MAAYIGSHCGQKLQCPSKCACGDEVREELEAQKPASAAITALVGGCSGVVGSRAIRVLLGRNGSIQRETT